MNKNLFNIIGWLTLIIMGILWIVKGYLSIYLLLVPVASLAFAIGDGSVKKVKKLRKITVNQTVFIIVSFILSVAIVFGLIQIANYVIVHIFELSGTFKTVSQIVAILVSLYPVKFIFWTVLHRVNEDLNAKSEA